MNFLAHAYLSFGHPEILVGNMISDFVKGRSQYDYDEGIRKGITLHRQIDEFTDSHDATREAKTFFRADYRLYSGAIIDIVYDHFLANDLNQFADTELLGFTKNVYTVLDSYSTILPPRFLNLLPYMQTENWLYHYKDRAGIERSIRGLVRRAAFISDHQTAFKLFEKHYPELQACYNLFFDDVKKFTKQQMNELI